MRRAIDRVREGLFRLLGVLSAVAFFLHNTRLGCPLSLAALVILVLGVVGNVRGILRFVAIYQAPVQKIYELSEAPLSESSYYYVQGWAFDGATYEEYTEHKGLFETYREVHQSYRPLVDWDSGWAILVATLRTIPLMSDTDQAEPVPVIVPGYLTKMDPELHRLVTRDNWGQYGIVMLDRVLKEVDTSFPVGQLIVLFLLVVGIGFLLLSRWFHYVIFWTEPARVLDWSAEQELGARSREEWWQAVRRAARPTEEGPAPKVELWLTGSIPMVGKRRRMQVVEASGNLQPTEDGWKITAYHERVAGFVAMQVLSESLKRVVPGRIYFGRRPRWGLWLLCQDPQGRRSRLYLRFADPLQRQVAYEWLTGRQDLVPCPLDPAGEGC